MPLERRHGAEGLPAGHAQVRLLARVRPHVGRQGGGERKVLPADLAGVRLLPRVDPHVGFQRRHVSEPLIAELADIRLLARVHTQVPLQFGLVLKDFSAGAAFVRHFTCVTITGAL